MKNFMIRPPELEEVIIIRTKMSCFSFLYVNFFLSFRFVSIYLE